MRGRWLRACHIIPRKDKQRLVVLMDLLLSESNIERGQMSMPSLILSSGNQTRNILCSSARTLNTGDIPGNSVPRYPDEFRHFFPDKTELVTLYIIHVLQDF